MCANPVCISNHVAHTHDTAQCHYYSPKGKGIKGKDKGQRHITKGKGQRHSLAFHSDGKGKGSKGKKGKNSAPKGFKGGKGTKGKAALGNRVMDPMSSSSSGVTNISENFKPIMCDFCHKPNHVRQNCRKLQALNNSKTYRQARDQHENRRQFNFNMLENSVFSPHTCSWCLSSECNGTHCYPPDDPVYVTETNNIFCEEILPLVKNAKLELPLDSADPLIPYQFHYEDSGWGQQWDSNFNYDKEQLCDSWVYDVAPRHPYKGTANWDNEWSESTQSTSTWPDNYLPNGSSEFMVQDSGANNADAEGAAAESNSNEESINLMIEEDDLEEPEQEEASSSSTGKI
jgi:hypothetical protein